MNKLRSLRTKFVGEALKAVVVIVVAHVVFLYLFSLGEPSLNDRVVAGVTGPNGWAWVIGMGGLMATTAYGMRRAGQYRRQGRSAMLGFVTGVLWPLRFFASPHADDMRDGEEQQRSVS